VITVISRSEQVSSASAALSIQIDDDAPQQSCIRSHGQQISASAVFSVMPSSRPEKTRPLVNDGLALVGAQVSRWEAHEL